MSKETKLSIIKQKIIKTDSVIKILAEKNNENVKLKQTYQELLNKHKEHLISNTKWKNEVIKANLDLSKLQTQLNKVNENYASLESKYNAQYNENHLKYQTVCRELAEATQTCDKYLSENLRLGLCQGNNEKKTKFKNECVKCNELQLITKPNVACVAIQTENYIQTKAIGVQTKQTNYKNAFVQSEEIIARNCSTQTIEMGASTQLVDDNAQIEEMQIICSKSIQMEDSDIENSKTQTNSVAIQTNPIEIASKSVDLKIDAMICEQTEIQVKNETKFATIDTQTCIKTVSIETQTDFTGFDRNELFKDECKYTEIVDFTPSDDMLDYIFSKVSAPEMIEPLSPIISTQKQKIGKCAKFEKHTQTRSNVAKPICTQTEIGMNMLQDLLINTHKNANKPRELKDALKVLRKSKLNVMIRNGKVFKLKPKPNSEYIKSIAKIVVEKLTPKLDEIQHKYANLKDKFKSIKHIAPYNNFIDYFEQGSVDSGCIVSDNELFDSVSKVSEQSSTRMESFETHLPINDAKSLVPKSIAYENVLPINRGLKRKLVDDSNDVYKKAKCDDSDDGINAVITRSQAKKPLSKLNKIRNQLNMLPIPKSGKIHTANEIKPKKKYTKTSTRMATRASHRLGSLNKEGIINNGSIEAIAQINQEEVNSIDANNMELIEAISLEKTQIAQISQEKMINNAIDTNNKDLIEAISFGKTQIYQEEVNYKSIDANNQKLHKAISFEKAKISNKKIINNSIDAKNKELIEAIAFGKAQIAQISQEKIINNAIDTNNKDLIEAISFGKTQINQEEVNYKSIDANNQKLDEAISFEKAQISNKKIINNSIDANNKELIETISLEKTQIAQISQEKMINNAIDTNNKDLIEAISIGKTQNIQGEVYKSIDANNQKLHEPISFEKAQISNKKTINNSIDAKNKELIEAIAFGKAQIAQRNEVEIMNNSNDANKKNLIKENKQSLKLNQANVNAMYGNFTKKRIARDKKTTTQIHKPKKLHAIENETIANCILEKLLECDQNVSEIMQNFKRPNCSKSNKLINEQISTNDLSNISKLSEVMPLLTPLSPEKLVENGCKRARIAPIISKPHEITENAKTSTLLMPQSPEKIKGNAFKLTQITPLIAMTEKNAEKLLTPPSPEIIKDDAFKITKTTPVMTEKTENDFKTAILVTPLSPEIMQDNALITPSSLRTLSPVKIEVNDFEMPEEKKTKIVRKLRNQTAHKVLERMLTCPSDNMHVKNAISLFKDQETSFIVRLIMRKVLTDKQDAIKGDSPFQPFLSEHAKVLFGFMVKLENECIPNLLFAYLDQSEHHLLKQVQEAGELEPITRLYVAICKYKKQKRRLQRMVWDALYFMGKCAVPFIYYVLIGWIEVFPRNAEFDNKPLLKVLNNFMNTIDCKLAVYNLLPVKSLLKQYYKFPEYEHIDKLLKDLTQDYLCTLGKNYEMAILILCKNCAMPRKVHKHVHLLQELVIISKDENTVKGLIVLIATIVGQFNAEDDIVETVNTWLLNIQTVLPQYNLTEIVSEACNILPINA